MIQLRLWVSLPSARAFQKIMMKNELFPSKFFFLLQWMDGYIQYMYQLWNLAPWWITFWSAIRNRNEAYKVQKHDFKLFLSIGKWQLALASSLTMRGWLLFIGNNIIRKSIWKPVEPINVFSAHESTNEWEKLKLIILIAKWLQSMFFQDAYRFQISESEFCLVFNQKESDILWNNKPTTLWLKSIKNESVECRIMR